MAETEHIPTSRRSFIADGALAPIRAAYLAEVERLAELHRADFESGRWFGWHYEDPDRLDEGGPDDPNPTERHPCHLLERELAPAIEDDPTAYMILACSPSEPYALDPGIQLTDLRSAAAEAMAIDVFKAARTHGWWRPGPAEYVGLDEWRALSDAEEVQS